MLEWRMREMLVTIPEDLATLAERVLEEIAPRSRSERGATVLALHGELGAGKTAFVQALARVLGVSEYVTSPTFVVMRRYPIKAHVFFETLVHMDAYRIESIAELAVLGFQEALGIPQNLICIEWAGNIAEVLPEGALHITFSHSDAPGEGALRKVVYGYKTETER